MTSPYTNRPTSTPKYVPPHRRHDATTPSSQQYLNYEDLHARYSPPNSPLRMPRVQRSLSVEDLRQRFQYREQDGSQAQESPATPPSPPVPPPPLPRDFEPLRAHGQRFKREEDGSQGQDLPVLPPPSPSHGHRFGSLSPPLQRPFLSPRFPDPPIFNGSKSANILFEDWKLRIKDKLLINKDHYPSEHSQVAYIFTRLGGKAIEHTLRKRRTSSYHSADDVLYHLSDIYEPTPQVIKETDHEAYYALEQGDRPFLEFYSDFMKHAPHYHHNDEEQAVFDLRDKLNRKLQKGLLVQAGRKWTLPEFRDHVMQMDYCYRTGAARKAKKKADRVTRQLAMASMEAQSKKPGRYAIMPPSDPDEFRR